MKQRPTKQSLRQIKQAKKEALQREIKGVRRQQWGMFSFIFLLIALVGGWIVFQAIANGNKQADAANTNNAGYGAVNGVSCDLQEHSQEHFHAHLSIYIDGQAVAVPANLGIADSCLYWLHTHNASGIVHVEAPKDQVYNLGTFVQIWGSRFSNLGYPAQLSTQGGWSAFVDGKAYDGDFRQLELADHQVITLHYNSPNAPIDKDYNFSE